MQDIFKIFPPKKSIYFKIFKKVVIQMMFRELYLARLKETQVFGNKCHCGIFRQTLLLSFHNSQIIQALQLRSWDGPISPPIRPIDTKWDKSGTF